MLKKMLFDPHLSRTESLWVIADAIVALKYTVVPFGQGQIISANSTHSQERARSARYVLAPTTLETTRRHPFLQVFEKGDCPPSLRRSKDLVDMFSVTVW